LVAVFSCTSIPPEPSDAHQEPTAAPILETPPVEDAVVVEIEPIAEVPADAIPLTEPVKDPAEEPIEVVPFDPKTVSVELKETTFFDVKVLISKLNKIIQAKDYDAWSAELTQAYREYYSSDETLARISEAAVLKRQKIVLSSLKDYFIHVVYPSRQNDRVDDIEFIDESRIRAIIVNVKGERLVLYNLEKIDDTWKIAIWR
jgi:hypothetical protein